MDLAPEVLLVSVNGDPTSLVNIVHYYANHLPGTPAFDKGLAVFSFSEPDVTNAHPFHRLLTFLVAALTRKPFFSQDFFNTVGDVSSLGSTALEQKLADHNIRLIKDIGDLEGYQHCILECPKTSFALAMGFVTCYFLEKKSYNVYMMRYGGPPVDTSGCQRNGLNYHRIGALGQSTNELAVNIIENVRPTLWSRDNALHHEELGHVGEQHQEGIDRKNVNIQEAILQIVARNSLQYLPQ